MGNEDKTFRISVTTDIEKAMADKRTAAYADAYADMVKKQKANDNK